MAQKGEGDLFFSRGITKIFYDSLVFQRFFFVVFDSLCFYVLGICPREPTRDSTREPKQETQQEKQDTVPDTSQVDIQLEDIYVTANKYPQKLFATGKQVQLISGDQLSYQGGNDFSELVNQTSVHVLGTRSNPTAIKSIYTRGAPSRHTLLMMDGIPLFDPSGIANIVDPRLLSLNGLEAVEVLKGGYSTLYGSNAVAGAINLRSISPLNRPYGMQGDVSYGSLNTYHGNLNFSDRVGLGPKKEKRPYIGYTASASWYGSTGISETDRRPRDVDANTLLENDETDRQSYSLAVEGKFFSNQLHVRSSVYHSRLDYDFDVGLFGDTPNTYANFEYSVFNNIINYQPNPKRRVTFKYSFQDMSRVFNSNFPDVYTSTSTSTTTVYLGQFHFFDLYTRYDFSDRFGFLVGLDYRFFSDARREFTSFRSQDLRPEVDHEIFSTSATYIEPYAMLYTKPFGDKFPLQMELGVRVQTHPSYADTGGYPFSFLGGSKEDPPVFLEDTSSDSDRLVSIDFNPFFVFKDKYKLYFSYATAYTLPTVFSLDNVFGAGPLTFGGEGEAFNVTSPLELGSEYTHSLSLGFDKAPPSLEKRKNFYISWHFASFYNITNRVIHYGSILDTYGVSENIEYLSGDRLRQVGIEVEPSFYFGPYWQLNMGYTGLWSVILYNVSSPAESLVDPVTNDPPVQMPGIPIHRLRGALIWKPKRPSLYLRLQSQLVGQRSDKLNGGFNLPDPSSPGLIYVSDDMPLYALVDFYAAYEMRIKKRYNLRFFVEAQNLLNNRSYREVIGYSTLGTQVRGGLRFSL